MNIPNSSSSDLYFNLDCVDPFEVENKNLWVKLEHLGRYLFAADYLKPSHPQCVADIACGLGYGLTVLEEIAERIIGIDHQPELLAQAEAQSGLSKTQFLTHDLEQDDWFSPLAPGSVDAVISFETLEHLVDPNRAIAKFHQLLKPEGVLICSVPNALYEPRAATGLPTNAAHKQLFNGRSLQRLLAHHGFQMDYQVGQCYTNLLYKRESQLLKHRVLKQRLGAYGSLHDPAIVRHLAYLLSYPTVEDVDGSYALIAIARKQELR